MKVSPIRYCMVIKIPHTSYHSPLPLNLIISYEMSAINWYLGCIFVVFLWTQLNLGHLESG